MKSVQKKPAARTVAFLFFLTILTGSQSLFGQQELFPSNYQLYPRNLSNNKALIEIRGTLQQTDGYTSVLLKRFRDGVALPVLKYTPVYTAGAGTYLFRTEIPAELNQYRFELYGFNGTTETLLKSADNVVAGDAFIIQGQSNAIANWRGDYSDANDANQPTVSPGRNFVRVWGSASATGAYTKAWFIGDGNAWKETDGNAGQWGMRMASQLAVTNRVPVCIFNGADPYGIDFFQRNDVDPADPATNYGRLLQRTKEAGLQNQIRAIFWYQGESDVEALGVQLTTQQYKDAFKSLYADWKADYPGVKNVYVFQIRLGCLMVSADACLQVQEAQRLLGQELRDVTLISTHNTVQLDEAGLGYCHFLLKDGYQVLGDRAANLALKQVYGRKSLPNAVFSPAPGQAWISAYASPGVANQVILALKDPLSTYAISGDIKQQFRLEGGQYTITSVALANHQLKINFTRNTGILVNPTGISFLSHSGAAAPAVYNEYKIGLISFSAFPVSRTAPGACSDRYENNSEFKPVRIPVNVEIKGTIGTENDVDWYKFNQPAVRTDAIKIWLYNLPAIYDIYLYDNNLKLIGSNTVNNTNKKVIIYKPGRSSAKYYIKVVGKPGNWSANQCYSLQIEGDTDNGKYDPKDDDDDDDRKWKNEHGNGWGHDDHDKKGEVNGTASGETDFDLIPGSRTFSMYPVPASHDLWVTYKSEKPGQVMLRITDLTGRKLTALPFTAISGQNRFRLDLSPYQKGLYFLELIQDGRKQVGKFLIDK